MLIITMDGGLITSISTDNPELKEKLGKAVVIDYDTEGMDEQALSPVKVKESDERPESVEDAFVYCAEVEDTVIDVEFLKNHL
jgi:hypothetical protein